MLQLKTARHLQSGETGSRARSGERKHVGLGKRNYVRSSLLKISIATVRCPWEATSSGLPDGSTSSLIRMATTLPSILMGANVNLRITAIDNRRRKHYAESVEQALNAR